MLRNSLNLYVYRTSLKVKKDVKFFVWFLAILIGFLFFTTFTVGLQLKQGLMSMHPLVWFGLIIMLIKLLLKKK